MPARNATIGMFLLENTMLTHQPPPSHVSLAPPLTPFLLHLSRGQQTILERAESHGDESTACKSFCSRRGRNMRTLKNNQTLRLLGIFGISLLTVLVI